MNVFPTIASASSVLLSITLLFFTYGLPLFATIRTVRCRDQSSYHQWLTYFVILFTIINPVTSLYSFHPVFQLAIILWLSLPRFQGAHYVYTQLIQTHILDKYSVEEKMDERIESFRQSIRTSMWNIFSDMSMSLLFQVGDVVGMAQSVLVDASGVKTENPKDVEQKESDSEPEENVSEPEMQEIHKKQDIQNVPPSSAFDFENSNSDKEEEEEDNDLTDNTEANTKTQIENHVSSLSSSLRGINSKNNLKSLGEIQEGNEESEDNDDESKSNELEVSETYLEDLKRMLQKGLYVFVWRNPKYSNSGTIISSSEDKTEDSESMPKKFTLQILTYQSSAEDTKHDNSTNFEGDCFVFHPKQSNDDDDDNDEEKESKIEQEEKTSSTTMVLPLQHIVDVRKNGTNSIEFLTISNPQENDDSLLLPPTSMALWKKSGTTSLSNNEEEDKGIKVPKRAHSWSCDTTTVDSNTTTTTPTPMSSSLLKQQLQQLQSSTTATLEEEILVVMVEMVLSDSEDRDALFLGLMALIDSQGFDDEDNNDDDKQVENNIMSQDDDCDDNGKDENNIISQDEDDDDEDNNKVDNNNQVENSTIIHDDNDSEDTNQIENNNMSEDDDNNDAKDDGVVDEVVLV